jgi:mRNA interferase HigB
MYALLEMHIISRKALKAFWETHPDSQEPLITWYTIVKRANFQSIHEVRTYFPHADFKSTKREGELTIFNIGGNKYRLLTSIAYDWQKVFIRGVMTHEEYTAWNRRIK